MTYTTHSLGGCWEMNYSENAYEETLVPTFDGYKIENAVPSYWEDMTEVFHNAPFFRDLKINPAYGDQHYPISETAPDMALPNYMGNFFYRKEFDYNISQYHTVIHFEGVQNTVSVWINDTFIGSHKGYSTPFDFDIPHNVLKNGVNTIVLSVSNLPLAGYGGKMVSGLTNRAVNEYTGGITGDIEIREYRLPLRDVCIHISDDLKTAFVKVDAVS